MSSPYINDIGYEVPEKTIAMIPFSGEKKESFDDILYCYKGLSKREWFDSHFYYCLPLIIGNQYGFGIKSLHDFNVYWDGTDKDAEIEFESKEDFSRQFIKTGFSKGIITVQNLFYLKTPPGINIMTIQPPNIFIPGISFMTGVIESDNIKRDFTFNLKITVPNLKISIKRGDTIGAFIPVPRYFVDDFEIRNAYDVVPEEAVNNELAEGARLSLERIGPDISRPHQSGRRYFNGENSDGSKYHDHQKRLT